MVLLEIDIPQRIEVESYHEFDKIGRYFRLLNPKIKVKEIGFNCSLCSRPIGYLGIIYMGKLTDKQNAATIQAIKQDQKDELLD